jgi:hypothetical protein
MATRLISKRSESTSLSLYAYVDGNPLNLIDPTGELSVVAGENTGLVPTECPFVQCPLIFSATVPGRSGLATCVYRCFPNGNEITIHPLSGFCPASIIPGRGAL